MKVDIWSDIRCPFCYIGKHRLEKALEKFEHSSAIEVSWHSFQLDPSLKTAPQTDIIEYFTQTKGVTREQARQMLEGANGMALQEGLEMHLEKVVLANSFLAHQLLQLAKSKGLGNQVKEALFKAHFTDAANIDDLAILIEVAVASGLDAEDAEQALISGKFEEDVRQDEMAAKNIGVRGVPYFVFNNKYAVSGAQPEEVFLEVLHKAWQETLPGENSLNSLEGDSCGTEACN